MGRTPDSIRRVGEADALELAEIARSTMQNWVRAGLGEPRDKLYAERDVLELIAFGAVVRVLKLRSAVGAWTDIGSALDSLVAERELDGVVLCIDLKTLSVVFAPNASALHHWVQLARGTPRELIVVPVGTALQEARLGFWRRARPISELRAGKHRAASKSPRAAGS